MNSSVSDVAVETTDAIMSRDLIETMRREAGYTMYRLVPIGTDGYRQSVHAEMIYHADSGRAGIAWGGVSCWTDCDGPQDAAERFFGLNGKEMSN